jgi:hypothetical protein
MLFEKERDAVPPKNNAYDSITWKMSHFSISEKTAIKIRLRQLLLWSSAPF